MLYNKCILVYGLNIKELYELRKANLTTLIITKEMSNMKLKDIIDGTRNLVDDDNIPNEKVILFYGYSSIELKETIKIVRKFITGGLLAGVTPVSINWTFKYLISHLMQEREWIEDNRRDDKS